MASTSGEPEVTQMCRFQRLCDDIAFQFYLAALFSAFCTFPCGYIALLVCLAALLSGLCTIYFSLFPSLHYFGVLPFCY